MFLNFSKLKPNWSKIKSAMIKNIILVIWVTVAYLVTGFLFVQILSLIKKLSPEIIDLLSSNQIMFSTLITFAVWMLTFVMLVCVPRALIKRQKLSKLTKLVTVELKKLGFTGWLKWKEIGLAITGIILAMLLRVGLVMLIQNIFPDFNINQRQELGFSFSLQNSRFDLMTVFVLLVILVPVAEETAFRGYLFGKLRSHSNFFMSMLIVSVLFGLAHYNGGGWISVVVTFSLSVVMCLTREVSGSIYPSILMHMMNNGVAFVALLYLPMLSGLN